ncbi:Protein of unknown function [Pseudonocardia thermophila]|jgi:hypothetical protein|uniref:DUF998 domain-containing protein n=1 Tax=Pseudonocardia thermophila TaxID=1848 RepID=A0A1M6VUG7_PSETH|nr:DUF998 domain-containing protein [Pseudonocardia thermophila]SHK85153.1 Protein of unknown function [Pseudonocardia thermophila]
MAQGVGASAGGVESAVVAAAVGVAAVTAGVLHVAGSGPVDPLRTVISDYVVVPGGYAMLALTAAALAVACVALAAGLHRAGLPRPALPMTALVTAAVALAVAGAVPTNPPDEPIDLAAVVHRIAGGVAFVALPFAAWWIARRAVAGPGEWAARAAVLRRCALASATLTAGFLAVQLPIVIGASPIFPFVGGAERLVCATVMVVLVTTARVMRTATAGTAGTPRPRTPDALPVGLGQAA